ncbi:TPR-like protein [Gyrodon lividus]|nr:TPR-like protein [Gyrodon lividus]
MADKQQQLVLSIIDFLNQSIDDGTVKADDREGLEIAIQCIGEAFGVDPSDETQRQQLSIKPAKLQTIFQVFLKTRDKVGSASSTSTPAVSKTPSVDDKKKAEAHKQTGNTHMSAKKHSLAIDSYDKAIALDPTNPVYFSNRAAAYSSKGDHASAVLDAEKAIEVDPSFVKAYSRLGYVVPHDYMRTRSIEALLQTCALQFGRLRGRGGCL